METSVILLIFVCTFLITITTYSTYRSFRSGLRDPFEEHED
ncbi:unnamed protein product [Ascophyllum nodosum]|uniref:Photosystem II protein N n=3 Tax=Fucales TaxID=3009 RepID=A0A2R4QQ07_9PHAE|nr:photosystem II protein N [Fucus vesiculosus]YP_009330465.1 PsbN [Coccophora langsdorfii]YP_010317811.1 photosystem II reaction center protein N [Silvetia siliquosa]AVZ00643.1 photosystem II protein N [Fucus spiralis]ANS72237.1 PsbN [Coccophora langsdorfii]UNH90248.1 photosystem II reaction center protein N [Silvetia siliquosa]CAX12509.1 photosystem II protein N [Fucus vesiculosus]